MNYGTCFVSPKYGVGFIAVPKVLTTSIKSALLGISGPPRDVHALAEQYRVSVSEARRSGVFLFTFVRNPAKRLVSTWANRVYQPESGRSRLTDPDQNLFSAGSSFQEFISRLEEVGVDAEIHLRPQIDFVMPKGRIAADMVCRFERLSDDWSILRKSFGVPKLKKMNASNGAVDLDRDMMRRITKLYAQDYTAFGYGSK